MIKITTDDYSSGREFITDNFDGGAKEIVERTSVRIRRMVRDIDKDLSVRVRRRELDPKRFAGFGRIKELTVVGISSVDEDASSFVWKGAFRTAAVTHNSISTRNVETRNRDVGGRYGRAKVTFSNKTNINVKSGDILS